MQGRGECGSVPVFSKKKPSNFGLIINQVVERVNDDAKRLRVLEQRDEVMSSRLTGIEQNLTSNYREFKKSTKVLEKKIAELQDKSEEIENKIGEIIMQFRRMASKADVKTIENLIEIYNPVKSRFVTIEEVRRLLKKRKA